MSDATPLASLLTLLTSPYLLGLMALAVPFGLLLGIVPGIGGRFGLVVAIPFIFGMEPVAGAVFLVSMHAVVHTGGSLPSILLGIPGGGPDAATVVDGYPMSRRGEAGRAIGASLASSAVGGLIGAVVLALGLPVVWPLLLSFGPAETFLLSLLGITFMAALSRADLLKGLTVGFLGLMLSFVGADSQLGLPRFTFGQTFLWDGIGIMAAMPAIFAVPEMVDMGLARHRTVGGSIDDVRISYHQLAVGARDVIRHRWLTLRASCLGAFIGIVPGLGGDVASWVCYGHAVQTSKHPERFGQGAVEGVIAPDAANNSKEGGALLPTLFFGIPGSSSMTLFLGALVVLGVQPGAQLLFSQGGLVWTLMWALALANIVGALMLAALGRWLTFVTFGPGNQLVPFAIIFIVIGALFGTGDVRVLGVLFVLGALGLLLKHAGWPRAPFAIGLVLGAVTERALHQAWALQGARFLLRPGAIILIALIAASVVFHFARQRRPRAVLPRHD
jgi:TctA family transporter